MMMTRQLPLLPALFLGLMAPSALLAQADTLRVGSVTWATAPAAGVDSSVVYLVRGGVRTKVMTFVETITAAPDGFLVVQHNIAPDGTTATLDSIALAKDTYATRWHSDVTPEGRMRVTFAGGRMIGTSIAAGVESRVDTATPAGALDFSVATVLMRHLPLSVGHSTVVPSFDIRRGAEYIPLKVTGEEVIASRGVKRKAWKIETAMAGRAVHFWVDQATRRTVRLWTAAGDAELIGERP